MLFNIYLCAYSNSQPSHKSGGLTRYGVSVFAMRQTMERCEKGSNIAEKGRITVASEWL